MKRKEKRENYQILDIIFLWGSFEDMFGSSMKNHKNPWQV